MSSEPTTMRAIRYDRTGPAREGVTVFKSVGHGIADLATAEWLLKCADS